jgi:hypothetical protein
MAAGQWQWVEAGAGAVPDPVTTSHSSFDALAALGVVFDVPQRTVGDEARFAATGSVGSQALAEAEVVAMLDAPVETEWLRTPLSCGVRAAGLRSDGDTYCNCDDRPPKIHRASVVIWIGSTTQ